MSQPHRFLGCRVQCEAMPGKTGTVVNVGASVGGIYTGHSEPTMDIVWDDGNVTRRVTLGAGVRDASASSEQGAWRITQEPRRTAVECDRIWYDHLMERARRRGGSSPQLTCAAADRPADPAQDAHASAGEFSPPLRAARFTSTAPPSQIPGVTVSETAAVEQVFTNFKPASDSATSPGRRASVLARQALQERFPGFAFSVSCARQRLEVHWVDGPLTGHVYGALAGLRGGPLVRSVRAGRSLSDSLVQGAVDYCIDRLFSEHDDPIARAIDRRRVNAETFCAGDLSDVPTPAKSTCPGSNYHDLIRCVLNRWDGLRQRFWQTRDTAALVMEAQALFPDGDLVNASYEMRHSLQAVRRRMEEGAYEIAPTRQHEPTPYRERQRAA